jgi:hypothetical protein
MDRLTADPSTWSSKGETFHAAGAWNDGRIVHDSKESWERFRDATLLPRLQ